MKNSNRIKLALTLLLFFVFSLSFSFGQKIAKVEYYKGTQKEAYYKVQFGGLANDMPSETALSQMLEPMDGFIELIYDGPRQECFVLVINARAREEDIKSVFDSNGFQLK